MGWRGWKEAQGVLYVLWSALEVGRVMVSGEGTERGMGYFSLPDI